MNINKLKLSDYFDGLVNELDLRVERFINDYRHLRNHQDLIDAINAKRDECIVEIRACEAANMSILEDSDEHSEEVIDNNELSNEQLFVEFCFLIETVRNELESGAFSWILISTDKYLSPGEIKCFHELIKFMPGFYNDHEKLLQFKSLTYLFSKNPQQSDTNLNQKLDFSLTIKNKHGLLNNLVDSNSGNCALIKAPSEQLFAFDDLTLDTYVGSIVPDAKYLFAKLTRLTLVSRASIKDIHVNRKPITAFEIKKMINEFEASTEFKRHLKYIELRFLDYASLEELPSLEVLDAMRNRVKAFSIVNVFQRFKITESKSSLLSYFSYNELSTQWLNLSQLTIRLSDVASIDERLFDLFPKLEHLNLSCGEIGTIKAHVFAKASNLADLNLCGNKIICLEEQSFCGLQNLKTLAVSATNGISQTIAFAGLDKLENLDLSYSCSLATIDSSTFAWLPLGIKKLDLSFCSIHSIDSKSFDHLANLDELVLSSNRIQSFEMGQAAPRVLDVSNDNRLCLVKLTSKKVDKVEKMDLRFYNFGEIQLESSYRMSGLRKLRINPAREMKFDSLPFLESLTLMIKDLDYLNQGQLECLSCLKCLELDLFHSVLKNEQRIDGSIFRGLVSLNKLTITRCKSVKRLEQTTFQYIPNVEYVDCSENSISSIEPGAFNVPSKLRHLNLTENLLEKCPSLNELRNLESLVLYENRINSLYGLFEGCEGVNMNLRLLDLGQNALSSLPDNAFSSLPSLITLNLRINPISRIARGAFTDLVNLRVLDLSYTCFNEIVIDIFSSSSYLENLRVLKCNGACLESCTGRSKESLVGFRHEVFVEAVSNYDSSFTILSDLFCKA